MSNFDDLKLAVEALSGGKNTVLFDDDLGTGGESFPSIMVRVPMFHSLNLYWARSETAISETADKYGRYCHSIAFNILRSHEDSEECVNDTFFNAWRAIPPQRPNKLSAFLGTITRNLSLNKWEQYSTARRGLGQVPLALEELQDCIPAVENVEQVADDLTLVEILNRFLSMLPKDRRKIFMRRYWYMCSIKEIAEGYSISESKVKMSLLCSRNELKQLLEKEGFNL